MRIKVDHIPEHGMTVAFQPPADHFPVLRQMRQNGEIDFPRPVEVRADVRRFGQMIEAGVQVTLAVEIACSRCLKTFAQPITVDFTTAYAPAAPPGPAESPGSTGQTPDDQTELLPYDGKEVDLTEAVQEQIVLALPIQPLCDPTCKGLCPGCGADLNTQTCACPPAVSESPFGALKNIVLKKSN